VSVCDEKIVSWWFGECGIKYDMGIFGLVYLIYVLSLSLQWLLCKWRLLKEGFKSNTNKTN
jgi:hypothetical protein